ncbi:hypothetical protein F3P66_05265 [Agrobacterium fabrum]|uniref:Uncharacterized protein n=1 Tax=Agrobacterium fabrum (strain C58 / ATCC 33970) TaxID=176299 RepID=A9CIL7_AGRFC|nr:hypothetical protein Atu1801 [Agrobacterium fabrum str. C58]QKW97038.1 hypothetical protein GSF67_08030 [Agrobacterium sp. CGMCC 11546]QRM58910.1 hypothetical protein F3P66_05265 [Agrobacterium fabrum]TRB26819.1 hypothetical protein EXN51_20145 [Agrobacterium fabrum]
MSEYGRFFAHLPCPEGMRHSPRIKNGLFRFGEAHDSVAVLLVKMQDTEAIHENCRECERTPFL